MSRPNISGLKYTHLDYIDFLRRTLKQYFNYDEKYLTYVCNVYGDRAFDLLKYIEKDPKLQEKMHSSVATLRGEILYSMERELCTNPIDFLARRTRIAFVDRKTMNELLPLVAREMGTYYKFDQNQTEEYLKQYQILLAKMEF